MSVEETPLAMPGPQPRHYNMCYIVYSEMFCFARVLVDSGDFVSSCYQENQADIMFPGDVGSTSERQAIKQLYCHFTCSDIIPAFQYDRLFSAYIQPM